MPGTMDLEKIVAQCALYYELTAQLRKISREFARNTMADDLKRMEYTAGEIIIIFIPEVMWDREQKQEFRRLRRS